MKEIGINIFVIGVGFFIDKKELILMVSFLIEDFNFVFDVFMYDVLKFVEKFFVKRIC